MKRLVRDCKENVFLVVTGNYSGPFVLDLCTAVAVDVFEDQDRSGGELQELRLLLSRTVAERH